MRKLFSIILIVLMASTSLFAGCDLITLNEAKYFNTVVIEIGDIEVTREEYIFRLNQLYSSYADRGYSQSQILDEVTDNIIMRELLVMDAEEQVGDLTQAQINSLWLEVYENVNSTLKGLESDVIEQWNIEDEWDIDLYAEDETEEEETFTVYEPYEPKVEYVYNEETEVWEFVRPAVAEEDIELPIAASISEGYIRESFFGDKIPAEDGLDGEKGYNSIQAEAWKRYIRNLKNSEEWKELSTDTESIFNRELDRLYEILMGNKYLALMEEKFENTQEVPNSRILEKYIEKVQESFAKYALDMDAYHEIMGSDAQSVYYHPSEEYIYVSHILVDYSEEQELEIGELKKQLEDGDIDQATYDASMDAIIANIGGKERDEAGLEVGEVKSAETILAELEAALAPYGTSTDQSTVEAKASIFNDFIYKYNSDPGMENAEYPYTINLDTDIADKMVKPFADEARRLYNEDRAGSVSELILTDFGYHIIFYSKPVQNIVNYNDLLNITEEELYETLLNPGSNKTMYDLLFEEVTARSYDDYRAGVYNSLKAELKITIYENKIEDILD